MCSSPHWQVGQSWFREKLSPANREHRLSRWADFTKNCLPRIGSKVLPRFREKYRALGRQKMGSNMRPRYIQFRGIHDRDISGLHYSALMRARYGWFTVSLLWPSFLMHWCTQILCQAIWCLAIILANWTHVVTQIWINIGSDNGLFIARRNQAITWTNVDLSSIKSSHLRAISKETTQQSITEIGSRMAWKLLF